MIYGFRMAHFFLLLVPMDSVLTNIHCPSQQQRPERFQKAPSDDDIRAVLALFQQLTGDRC